MGARLGQHFLRDQRVLDDIVASAHLASGQSVLEIGPGPGNLTERLVAAVGATGRVVAVEADRGFVASLRGRWANVELVHADAVREDLSRFGRFDRIVANLPYLISGPITIAFLDLLREPATTWERAVLMYQKEFGARLLANAGDDAYGRLSVHAARFVRVEKIRDVSPGAFDPPPEVDSVVLAMEPHAAPPFVVADEALWAAVVDGAFQGRRKKMRNTVPGAVAARGISKDAALAALECLGLAEVRPEEVSPASFAKLVAQLAGGV